MRAWLLRANNGSRLLLEPAGTIDLTVISLGKALSTSIDAKQLFETLAEILESHPSILTEERYHSCDAWGCARAALPATSTIAKLLLALRTVLAQAPSRPVVDEDGEAWSTEEAEAAIKASILLDIAAALLRDPSTVHHLPSEVEMLIKKSEEGTLLKYLKKEEKKENGENQ